MALEQIRTKEPARRRVRRETAAAYNLRMEPRIQYCRTRDGVDIAYAREGSGAPYVVVPNMWANIPFVYQLNSGLLEANTAHGYETILPESRNTGASQRDAGPVSLETRLLDLEAVVDHLGLRDMVLMGVSHGGPPAIAYAVRHPEQVSRLILANTYASGEAYYALAPVMRAFASIEAMARDQWEFYTRTAANAVLGFGNPELAERMAATYRDSMTPDSLVAYREASRETDVTGILGDVRCPTLVVDDKSSTLRVEELSRNLASGIAGARLATIDSSGPGIIGSPLLGRAIEEFLGVPRRADEGEDTATPVTVATMSAILFVDIAESTAITERIGDAAFREASRTLDQQVRRAITGAGGKPVEGRVLGDGVMGIFTSAAQAIEAAQRCAAASADVELPLHIGIHAGDVISEGDNVYGGAVNIASRICGLSEPGEILVSDIVRGLARTSAGVLFEDRGEHRLKGIAEAQRVFAVAS
jgi:class 3 adenylate cyclase/pimeloyl-ACP methyl ester carboxylesterase